MMVSGILKICQNIENWAPRFNNSVSEYKYIFKIVAQYAFGKLLSFPKSNIF